MVREKITLQSIARPRQNERRASEWPVGRAGAQFNVKLFFRGPLTSPPPIRH